MKVVQIVGGILLFVVVGVYAVMQQVQVVQLGYELHATDHRASELEESCRRLQAQIAQRRNPRRLAEAAAKFRLKIVPPDAPAEEARRPR